MDIRIDILSENSATYIGYSSNKAPERLIFDLELSILAAIYTRPPKYRDRYLEGILSSEIVSRYYEDMVYLHSVDLFGYCPDFHIEILLPWEEDGEPSLHNVGITLIFGDLGIRRSLTAATLCTQRHILKELEKDLEESEEEKNKSKVLEWLKTLWISPDPDTLVDRLEREQEDGEAIKKALGPGTQWATIPPTDEPLIFKPTKTGRFSAATPNKSNNPKSKDT